LSRISSGRHIESPPSIVFPAFADEIGVITAFEDRPQAAVIQAVGSANGTLSSASCTVHGMVGRRLLLKVAEPIHASTPINVKYNDAMFLGEVMICVPEVSGVWRLEIKVEQTLTGLESLIALRARLLGEGIATASDRAPAEMRVQLSRQ